MATFLYRAATKHGAAQSGSIKAATEKDARVVLEKQGLEILEINEQKPVKFEEMQPLSGKQSHKVFEKKASKKSESSHDYAPFSQTLRLYAGWLLAWYGIIELLGSLQEAGRLPFYVPYLNALFYSPLVLTFACGTFFFLLLTSLHAWLGRGTLKGVALSFVWVVLTVGFAVNI